MTLEPVAVGSVFGQGLSSDRTTTGQSNLAQLWGGGGHRIALENRAAPDGSVFLSGPYPRQIKLPGVILRQVVGHGPVTGDMPYMGSLFLASRPRAFLENLLPSRRSNKVSKTVGRQGVEQRLAETLRNSGEVSLNQLRDQARALAPVLGLKEQFRILEGLMVALLRSRSTDLSAPTARLCGW